MRITLIIAAFLFTMNLHAQDKKIWAKSFLNEKAPELIVEKWLTDAPETEGKFVLIDFWATWCGPCRKTIPEFNKYQKAFNDDLIIVGLSNESERKINKMKGPVIEYYSAIDKRARLNKLYKVRGIPHCVIINPDGIVVWEGFPSQPGFELTQETITNLIQDYKS